MTNVNGDVSGCYVMLTQDRVKPQTIIQQNAAIGTVAVDGWGCCIWYSEDDASAATRRQQMTHDSRG